MSPPLTLLLMSALFSACLSRLLRWAGNRVGLRDIPDGVRKLHSQPVPAVGGLALLVALPTSLFLTAKIFPEFAGSLFHQPKQYIFGSFAIVMMAGLGILDDIIRLKASYKLIGQIVFIELFLRAETARMDSVWLFGEHFSLRPLDHACTVLWYVFVINALNLLDGMDGMLVMIAIPIVLGMLVLAALTGAGSAEAISVSLAGGLVGFLIFNKPPASIYLGNSGSMIVGLLIASLSLEVGTRDQQFAIVPLAALVILPALDTLAAVLRRKLSGRSVAQGDRQHLHHVLCQRGLSIGSVLWIILGLGAVAACGAVASFHWNEDGLAVATALVIPSLLLVSGLFGTFELRLIVNRVQGVWKWRGSRTRFSPFGADTTARSTTP